MTARQAMAPPGSRLLFGTERLLAFSDGVFAVAITLLVIDLRLPDDVARGDAALFQALRQMQPKFVVFVFTFLVVGLNWLAHHRKFSLIRTVDERMLWLNLLYLMTLCLVPFVTSVLSGHGGRDAFVLYAIVLAAVSALSTLLTAYGVRAPFIGERHVPAAVKRALVLVPLLTGAIFLGAAALALAVGDGIASWTLLLIVPVSILFNRRHRAHPD